MTKDTYLDMMAAACLNGMTASDAMASFRTEAIAEACYNMAEKMWKAREKHIKNEVTETESAPAPVKKSEKVKTISSVEIPQK